MNPPAPARVPVRHALAPLLEARSIALVGASERPDSFGRTLVEQLVRGGYEGDVHPVNPRYETIHGYPAVPSVRELDRDVDLVVLGIANARLEEELRAAADAGARAAVIFASCHDDPGLGRPSLAERLTRIADEAGMALCGGNCMGFLNLAKTLRVSGFRMPSDLDAGGITFISHSGSAFSALAYNTRALRFNLLVSAGLELNTSVAAYMEYALEQPETKVVALFLETVREPERFRAALERAERAGIPVVALKVGRVGRARALVAAHSGALAGEDGAYEALFRAHGVARVDSLDEMADVLELLSAGRMATSGGLATIHDSGGERALVVDAAASVGVPFARISPETSERLAATLEPGLEPVNPLDAWGTGNDFEPIFDACMQALLDDADTAALAFCVDLTTQEIPETGYVRVAKEVFARTTKPLAVLSNLASAIDRSDVASLRAAGVPVLEGTFTGLRAFKHLFALRDARRRPRLDAAGHVDEARRARWRHRLRSPTPWTERDALALLDDYGIPTTRPRAVATPDEAEAAAAELGWPVALKTAAPGVAHKSHVGGVVLGIARVDELRAAYADLARRLGPDALVAPMAPPGVELAFGIVRDAQFGPLVMVAAGGVLVEVLGDRCWALPPLDGTRARELLDGLRTRPLLDGVRGTPGVDVDAIVDALVSVSLVAAELGEDLDALDVNPLIAGPSGCVAVDALVVQRGDRLDRVASEDGRKR